MVKFRKANDYKGIYCLEGTWDGMKSKTTVEPALSVLEKNNFLQVPYLRFHVATQGEFEFHLDKWVQPCFKNYPILYLSFHGAKGKIYLGDTKTEINFQKLGELLEDKCEKRVIHFGSCSTLKVGDSVLNDFQAKTGALALLGYEANVDWMYSFAFEVLLLSQIQYNAFYGKNSMKSLDERLSKIAASLRETLKFRMHY